MKNRMNIVAAGRVLVVMLALWAAALVFAGNDTQMGDMQMNENGGPSLENNTDQNGLEVATFAGGCFWCVESDFEKIDGVVEAVSGYTGGNTENPSYDEVSSGGTGHTEAVQVYFDPQRVSYNDLLDVFWRHINPTDGGGQFVDRGSQYRSEIFYHNDLQRKLALASRDALEKSKVFKMPIVTAVTAFTRFYRAEDYHQDYYKKNKVRYRYYRWGSGRDRFLEDTWKTVADDKSDAAASQKTGHVVKDKHADASERVWKKPDAARIKAMLTPLQYKVTQKEGTEPAFNNAYWDNKADGIYVDVVSGEPLFSSRDKFASGTGWPSFTRPLVPDHIVERRDERLFMVRTEVRSRYADSHLGHVFDDGPEPGGYRYCINSAALRFIPKAELEAQGYARYKDMF